MTSMYSNALLKRSSWVGSQSSNMPTFLTSAGRTMCSEAHPMLSRSQAQYRSFIRTQAPTMSRKPCLITLCISLPRFVDGAGNRFRRHRRIEDADAASVVQRIGNGRRNDDRRQFGNALGAIGPFGAMGLDEVQIERRHLRRRDELVIAEAGISQHA